MTTDLYRHFDADGKLLYVGVSFNAFARLSQHQKSSSWVGKIATMTIEKFDTREAALRAESEAIASEAPERSGPSVLVDKYELTSSQIEEIEEIWHSGTWSRKGRAQKVMDVSGGVDIPNKDLLDAFGPCERRYFMSGHDPMCIERHGP